MDIRVDGLTNLTADLKTLNGRFGASLRRNLRATIQQQGQVVVGAVRSRASWSKRIPGATGLSVRFSTKAASVKVSVDHNLAPHARPLEEGNRNSYSEDAVNRLGGYRVVNGRRVAVNHSAYAAIRKTGIGLGRVLRHPVYNKGGFAEMETRPFFKPAVDQASPGIVREMEALLVKTATDAGFKEI